MRSRIFSREVLIIHVRSNSVWGGLNNAELNVAFLGIKKLSGKKYSGRLSVEGEPENRVGRKRSRFCSIELYLEHLSAGTCRDSVRVRTAH